MTQSSEGKTKDVFLNYLDDFDQQLETYAERRPVPGAIDVLNGLRVQFPTTVYALSGDDTSGVVGMLMPSGEFLLASERRTGRHADFWEFDETLQYEKVLENGQPVKVTGPYGKTYDKVKANSWTRGEVAWDGVVTGSVNTLATDGDNKGPVSRREWDVALTGDWQTTGELWKAIERGTSMVDGRRSAVVHISHLADPAEDESTKRKAA